MRKASWNPTRKAAAGLAGMLLWAAGGCVTKDEKQSDDIPPDHMINLPVSQGKYVFGVTDTIAVEFNENIDTGYLHVAFSDSAGIASRFKGQRRLLIFGKSLSDGQTHFPVNLEFTATLAGLRDISGNGLPALTESFRPLPWADKDFLLPGFDAYDSLFSSPTAWLDGTSLGDTIITEGSMDFRRLPGEPIDTDDFKLIRLVGSDTAALTLTTRKDIDLALEIYGPYHPDSSLMGRNLDSAVFTGKTGATGRLNARVVADVLVHKRKFDDFDAPGIYVLKLAIPQNEEGFYRLGLKVRKFK